MSTPVAPWQLNPYRLWSLWDMFEVEISGLVESAKQSISAILYLRDQQYPPDAKISAKSAAIVIAWLDPIYDFAVRFGFNEVVTRIDRMKVSYQGNRGKTFQDLSIDTQQALDSFVLATKGREFLFIDPAQTAKYKATPEDMFGAKACQAFPSAVRDLQEALRCHALYRYSACAFHLMRVMELPVRAVWRSLKDNPTGVIANGWSAYTNEIEHEIEKREKSKPHPAEWQQRRSFYQAARNNLNSAYRAWRCPMMHLENLDKTYTLEQMEEIIIACRTLFRDIAEHLDEAGTYS